VDLHARRVDSLQNVEYLLGTGNQHITAQYSTAHHSTSQYSTAQRSTAKHSEAQRSTAKHNTPQHSTAQYAVVPK
jgi:hypothetical protein